MTDLKKLLSDCAKAELAEWTGDFRNAARVAVESFAARIEAALREQVPAGWQARFIQTRDRWDAWSPCTKEHHDLVKRTPEEWPGYEVRPIFAAPLVSDKAVALGVSVVQVTSHLDELDAPLWEFINAEARALDPVMGSIDAYGFRLHNGAQPNGSLVVLWKGRQVHALAVTVRDGMNHTACVRVLAGGSQPVASDFLHVPRAFLARMQKHVSHFETQDELRTLLATPLADAKAKAGE